MSHFRLIEPHMSLILSYLQHNRQPNNNRTHSRRTNESIVCRKLRQHFTHGSRTIWKPCNVPTTAPIPAPLFVLEGVTLEVLPVPPLVPPPASPDPLLPPVMGGKPWVPVAAEPDSVLDEEADEDFVEVLMVLMLEFDIVEDCAWEIWLSVVLER